MFERFARRSRQLERIDTGDYTPAEYERFLREIRFINRHLGDARALRKTLLGEIERSGERSFSLIDIGAGSGELLRQTAKFAGRTGRPARLVGVDLNAASAASVRSETELFPNISAVRGDAFCLPFADAAFDYAVTSLFAHHLTDEQIPAVLREMSRVARRGVIVIDLCRHPAAYYLYRVFCRAFRISPLVTHDGSLSILKGFTPQELIRLFDAAGLRTAEARRVAPFRIAVYASAAPRDL